MRFILAILTPRAGEYNHRWLIPANAVSRSDYSLSVALNALDDLESGQISNNGMVFFHSVIQPSSGRNAKESLFLYCPDFKNGFTPVQQSQIHDVLESFFQNQTEDIITSLDVKELGDITVYSIPALNDLYQQIGGMFARGWTGVKTPPEQPQVQPVSPDPKTDEENSSDGWNGWKWFKVMVVIGIGCLGTLVIRSCSKETVSQLTVPPITSGPELPVSNPPLETEPQSPKPVKEPLPQWPKSIEELLEKSEWSEEDIKTFVEQFEIMYKVVSSGMDYEKVETFCDRATKLIEDTVSKAESDENKILDICNKIDEARSKMASIIAGKGSMPKCIKDLETLLKDKKEEVNKSKEDRRDKEAYQKILNTDIYKRLSVCNKYLNLKFDSGREPYMKDKVDELKRWLEEPHDYTLTVSIQWGEDAEGEDAEGEDAEGEDHLHTGISINKGTEQELKEHHVKDTKKLTELGSVTIEDVKWNDRITIGFRLYTKNKKNAPPIFQYSIYDLIAEQKETCQFDTNVPKKYGDSEGPKSTIISKKNNKGAIYFQIKNPPQPPQLPEWSSTSSK